MTDDVRQRKSEARIHLEGAVARREEIFPLQQRAFGLRNSIYKSIRVGHGLQIC